MSEEQLYLTGAVIANGIPDSDGDTLNNVEIRTIFTKYTNHLSDIQHDSIDYDGVKVLANWISENDTTIAGNNIPAKSWLATLKVTDTETIKAIQDGELTCFSLGSVSSTAKTREGWFINKRISYHDLKSIEDVIPLRISIVDEGANGLPFEVTDYITYINKQSDKMTDNKIEDAKFSIKEFLGLKKVFIEEMSINKAEETPVEEPDAEPAPETDAEKTIDALFEKIDLLLNEIAEIKQAVSTDIEKAEEEKEEEQEGETATETTQEEAASETEEEPATEEAEPQEEEEDYEKKIEKETKETIITKSTVKPHDIPVTSEPKSDFRTRTNRDALFRKIKQ